MPWEYEATSTRRDSKVHDAPSSRFIHFPYPLLRRWSLVPHHAPFKDKDSARACKTKVADWKPSCKLHVSNPWIFNGFLRVLPPMRFMSTYRNWVIGRNHRKWCCCLLYFKDVTSFSQLSLFHYYEKQMTPAPFGLRARLSEQFTDVPRIVQLHTQQQIQKCDKKRNIVQHLFSVSHKTVLKFSLSKWWAQNSPVVPKLEITQVANAIRLANLAWTQMFANRPKGRLLRISTGDAYPQHEVIHIDGNESHHEAHIPFCDRFVFYSVLQRLSNICLPWSNFVFLRFWLLNISAFSTDDAPCASASIMDSLEMGLVNRKTLASRYFSRRYARRICPAES